MLIYQKALFKDKLQKKHNRHIRVNPYEGGVGYLVAIT